MLAAALVVALLQAPATPPPARAESRLATQHLPEPVARAAKAPRLVVDLKKGKHRISPLIYGVNFADKRFAKSVDLPVDRWGGNAIETYNWQLRGSNHGQDWYFTNFADCWTDAFDYCQRGQDFSAADAQVQQDRATKTATLLTLPLLGWVAKAVSYAGDHPCSYPASANPQDDHDPYHSTCGNGRRNGQWLTADPNQAGGAGRAGVLRAVDRRAQGEVRRRRERRRLDLRARQRAGALGRHPPRLPPAAHDVRRAVDQVARPRAGGQGRRPGRGHAGPGRVGLAELLLLGRRQRRPGLLRDLAGPRRARRHRAVGVVPPAVRGLPAADRPSAARLLRPALLPAGPVLPRHRRDPPALGPEVHRPVVDQRQDRAAPPDAGVGAQRLPGHRSSASASTTSVSA